MRDYPRAKEYYDKISESLSRRRPNILLVKKAFEEIEGDPKKECEQVQTSKVVEQKEICIDEEDNIDSQLELLEKTLEIAPILEPAEIGGLQEVGE